MSRLRMAVVGIGFWGKNHVRVIDELRQSEIVAVCDMDLQRAEAIAQKYEVKAYDDSVKMYKKERLDAVTICVWSTKLAYEASKALKAGKHVLVEKPMANSTKEAKKILDLAKTKNLHLSVGFIERFNPGVRHVKEIIENGQIGVPVSAIVKRVSKWPQRIGDIGVVKDTAIHDIDIIRYIFEEDPFAVYARTGNLRHEKFEDYAQIMLAFSSGRTAFLEANWLTPYKIRNLAITGSDAIVSVNYITQEVTLETSGETLKPRYEYEEPLKLELKHFTECVLNNKEPLVTSFDGFKALNVAEASLRSATDNKLVRLMN